ncbi:50S ribosomal protein L3 [bacterium]|nr:50S ribosomal protein L3 [bacterium]MBU3955748.1 50S ribosomal protein L3 [bacterium]MBU4134125.1 50S ribosomal protein L3 [bacterium]
MTPSENKSPKLPPCRAVLGMKGVMCRVFTDTAELACTVVDVPVNSVVGIKTAKKDGYEAMQIAFEGRKSNKPLAGIAAKAGMKNIKASREIRGAYEGVCGDKIQLSDIFEKGSVVSVTGISKGKGFASTRKRWHFKGGPKSHGQKRKYRSPGSIGSSSYPSRVLPGIKMAGRMGSDKVTVKNMKVASVDADKNKLYIVGAAPGSRGGILVIKKIK